MGEIEVVVAFESGRTPSAQRLKAGRRRSRVVALLSASLLAGAAAGCSPAPSATPAPVPTRTLAPSAAPAAPSPSARPEPTPSPSAPPPASAIEPGSVNRTSLDVSATYRVDAALSVASGALEVATVIEARNVSGDGIDRLELNTIAARLGGIRITEASVDDHPVKATIHDQTVIVPLGGILPDGASTTVRIGYRATLRRGLAGSDWMFTRANGTVALYRWIPWISRATPFDRPNHGDPFVTPSSPRVDVELLVDAPLVLAGPAPDVVETAAGAGRSWSFTMRDVRDVSVVLAPNFELTEGAAGDLPIRVFDRPGGASGERLLELGVEAALAEAERLGVAYPWPGLTVVETEGGYGLESPGLVWIPRNVSSLNREYLVFHEVAHQWFYGLVGNDQQAEPFADEAAADLLARTALDSLRGSRCSRAPLDRPITGYSNGCYYEVVYVQGGAVLDSIRRQMGTARFWTALRGYVEAHRNGLGGTRALLEALRAGSPVDLLPTLRARFPSLY